MEQRKIGPIDLSALDARKGPSPQRNAGAAMGAAKSTGANMFKSFGFGAPAGDDGNEGMTSDRYKDDPQYKEDLELGIDRSQVDPIKFVSAIDSKPIYPPYLKLADFDNYLLQDASGGNPNPDKGKKENVAASGEKGNNAKDDAAGTVNSTKAKRPMLEDVTDHKQDWEEFKENIGDLYYDKAVKLMEDVEERKRQEKRNEITIQ